MFAADARRAVITLAGALCAPLAAQDPAPVSGAPGLAAPEFAAPVQLRAGEAFLGGGRMYPSPVYHDVDGDGRLDVVVGDLRGHLTVAWRRPDGTFADEQKLEDVAGKVLDFGNW